MADNKPKRRNALGRGLGALLEDSSSDKHELESSSIIGSINEIPLGDIEVNPYQPRTDFDQESLEELAESIKVQGIIQPITVRKLASHQYQLISGERRLQASKIAGLEKIPAYIRVANDQQMLEMALIENIQRENLNAIEIALSYQRLIAECSLKQEELGERVGKKRTTVTNYLRLLKLPPDVQAGIRDGKISMGHARALISIEDIGIQLKIFGDIVKNDLSVRKTEELVRQYQTDVGQEKPVKEMKGMSYELNSIQDKLSSHFGTKVYLKNGADNKGEIKIPYISHEDLNRILEIINF